MIIRVVQSSVNGRDCFIMIGSMLAKVNFLLFYYIHGGDFENRAHPKETLMEEIENSTRQWGKGRMGE